MDGNRGGNHSGSKDMDKTLTIIGVEKLWAVVASTLLAVVTPTAGFLTAIVTGWAFNMWCGMRADGVTLISCRNFSWKKFVFALAELLMYVCLVEVVALVGYSMGDGAEIVYACKTMAYFIIYCYLDNGLKNLCKAHPRRKALWLIYLMVHLDLRRVAKIDELMERYKEHTEKQKDEDNRNTTEKDNAEPGAEPEG